MNIYLLIYLLGFGITIPLFVYQALCVSSHLDNTVPQEITRDDIPLAFFFGICHASIWPIFVPFFLMSMMYTKIIGETFFGTIVRKFNTHLAKDSHVDRSS